MHHPLDWLAPWARSELEKIIPRHFALVLSGHIHENSATYCSSGGNGTVFCGAPPLFTKKSESLGYAIISLDTGNVEIEVTYRQWTPSHKFVSGTGLAGNDQGKIIFRRAMLDQVPLHIVLPKGKQTEDLLKMEFDEA